MHTRMVEMPEDGIAHACAACDCAGLVLPTPSPRSGTAPRDEIDVIDKHATEAINCLRLNGCNVGSDEYAIIFNTIVGAAAELARLRARA